jgi:hypothetical protein
VTSILDSALIAKEAANSTKKEVQSEQETSSSSKKQRSMPAGVK